MRLGEIEITPLAAESLGTRSLCTHVVTPDVSILFDPSVALAKRYNLEPHPTEYLALRNSLGTIGGTSIPHKDDEDSILKKMSKRWLRKLNGLMIGLSNSMIPK